MNAAIASECPDENALSELVQGLLESDAAAQLEAHLDGCAECRRIVSSVGQSSYLARRQTSDSARGGTWGMLEPSNTPTWAQAGAGDSMVRQPGEILAGKYRIERQLGQGGMGVVMAARHLSLGKLVAIKLMRPDLVVDPGAAQRFVREARAASRLRSEHIVRVIDLDTLDDGAPYIAMEFLEGEDLGAMLARRGPLPVVEAATCIAQVCDAVAEAHDAGIVHRDLKPANLYVTRRGDGSPCMKVLDFGVSKIIAGGPLADDLTTTDTKALVGSPHYMSPEQLISAKAVDPRTDVWALGIILFELFTGHTPFQATSLAQTLASILRDEVPSLQSLRPELPAELVAVVARCLDKDPAGRFQKVSELALALAPFVATVEPAPVAPTAVGPTTTTQVVVPVARRPRWPWLVLLIGVVLGAVVAGVVTREPSRDAVPAFVPALPASPPPPPVKQPRLEDDLLDPKL